MFAKLKSFIEKFKQELVVYQLVLSDSRTPHSARVLLGLAVSYAICPIDIIPDFIPGIGLLDDMIIVPGLVFAALKLVPKDVVADCRERACQMTPSMSDS